MVQKQGFLTIALLLLLWLCGLLLISLKWLKDQQNYLQGFKEMSYINIQLTGSEIGTFLYFYLLSEKILRKIHSP